MWAETRGVNKFEILLLDYCSVLFCSVEYFLLLTPHTKSGIASYSPCVMRYLINRWWLQFRKPQIRTWLLGTSWVQVRSFPWLRELGRWSTERRSFYSSVRTLSHEKSWSKEVSTQYSVVYSTQSNDVVLYCRCDAALLSTVHCTQRYSTVRTSRITLYTYSTVPQEM